MKTLHNEIYKGFIINICGRYIKDYYDWDEGITNAVRLYYNVTTPDGDNFEIDDYQYYTVAQKKPTRFLFWTFKPKLTFEEQVKEDLNYVIEIIKNDIDKKLYEEEMTRGLLESLRK